LLAVNRILPLTFHSRGATVQTPGFACPKGNLHSDGAPVKGWPAVLPLVQKERLNDFETAGVRIQDWIFSLWVGELIQAFWRLSDEKGRVMAGCVALVGRCLILGGLDQARAIGPATRALLGARSRNSTTVCHHRYF